MTSQALSSSTTEQVPVVTEQGGRLRLLVNPGSRSAARLGELLTELPGLRIEVLVAEHSGQLQTLAREAADDGCRRLVVAGGDGTLSHVVQGLAPDFPEIELALLPLGTGNDLARLIGLAEDELSLAGRLAVGGTAVPVDVVRFRSGERTSHFVNVANGGFGGRVARSVNEQSKELIGTMAYWLASASAMASPDPFDVELTLDGRTITETLIGLAIANGRFVGGGFAIAPEAEPSDGLLDVTRIPNLSTMEMLAAGTRFIISGDPSQTPVEMLRARKVSLRSTPPMPFSIDGELVVADEAEFEVIPGALALVTNPIAAQAQLDMPEHAAGAVEEARS